jgi:alginate O-acetyltransferase complex protein AlgI
MIHEPFLWAFLLGSVAAFWLTPKSFRLITLSMLSVVFIGCYDLVSLMMLAAASSILYLVLPIVSQRKPKSIVALVLGTIILALPLVSLKLLRSSYVPLSLSETWVVPLGMSYYVFRLIGVLFDSYRTGQHPKSAADYFGFVFLFTIFVAGPIQRYGPFLTDRTENFKPILILEGLTRIASGLMKQGVVFYAIVNWRDGISGGVSFESLDVLMMWVYLITVYLSSYINLSAYSDIAIGSSKLFGFKIMENFALPVLATSIDDFWRRWHISLSSWCQSYVYAPVLGAFRNPYIAIVLSFLVMGLWHTFTLNRVAWSLFQAIGVIVVIVTRRSRKKRTGAEKFRSVSTLLGWVSTQIFITLSFVFVLNEESNDVLTSLRLVCQMVTFGAL